MSHGNGCCGVQQSPAPPLGTKIVCTNRDLCIDSFVRQVDVTGEDVTLTLAANLPVGFEVTVNALDGAVLVKVETSTCECDNEEGEEPEFLVADGESVVFTKTSCGEFVASSGAIIATADYVVVGLGTAGAPFARYITDDLETSAIVLEAGINAITDPRVNTSGNNAAGDLFLTGDPKYSKVYGADPGAINPGTLGVYPYSDGRMWGGSSGHNGLVAVRADPQTFDDWATLSGSSQWGYNALLPIMKGMERYIPNGTPVDPTQRGTTGPLDVAQFQSSQAGTPLVTAIAGAGLNMNYVVDYNAGNVPQVGTSARQNFFDPSNNVRDYALPAFLPQAGQPQTGAGAPVIDENGNGLDGRKLRIISQATATQIILAERDDEIVAIGVRYILGGDPTKIATARARKKVVVSAGTYASAKLLQLSGIGPTSVLQAAGVPVVVANEHVGRNIQNHYGPIGAIPQPAPALPNAQVRLANFSDGSGPDVGPGGTPVPADGLRRLQMNSSLGSGLVPTDVLSALFPTSTTTPPGPAGISFVIFMMNTNRLGSVEIFSDDPLADPFIRSGYYQDGTGPGSDMELAVRGLKIMFRISMALTGSPPIYPPVQHYPAPFGPAANDALLQQDCRTTRLIAAFHSSGSCRMAQSAGTGVVDANLDVFGVKGLSVCDNAVVPRIASGNTAYQAYVLGIKKAQIEGATVPTA